MEFTGDIAKAVNSIRLRLLGRSLPPALYHYTSFGAVLNIGTSRVIWATAAADLEDATEIEYGAELVQEQVERKVKVRNRCVPRNGTETSSCGPHRLQAVDVCGLFLFDGGLRLPSEGVW
jgi:hypothetical protein